MKEIWVWIQAALAAVGGFLGWFLGGWDGFLYALLAFAVLDYLTGVLCAIADKKLSSEIGFKGISRKVLIFALVGVGNIIDSQVLGDGGAVRTAQLEVLPRAIQMRLPAQAPLSGSQTTALPAETK